MGRPKVYESPAIRQKIYRSRRDAEGKSMEKRAEQAIQEFHREVAADAARGDSDQARFAKAALGRSPLETALKVMFFAELIDPTEDNDGAFGDEGYEEQAILDEERRDYMRRKAMLCFCWYLNPLPEQLELRGKYWSPKFQ